jgi:hypothetical protein
MGSAKADQKFAALSPPLPFKSRQEKAKTTRDKLELSLFVKGLRKGYKIESG